MTEDVAGEFHKNTEHAEWRRYDNEDKMTVVKFRPDSNIKFLVLKNLIETTPKIRSRRWSSRGKT